MFAISKVVDQGRPQEDDVKQRGRGGGRKKEKKQYLLHSHLAPFLSLFAVKPTFISFNNADNNIVKWNYCVETLKLPAEAILKQFFPLKFTLKKISADIES